MSLLSFYLVCWNKMTKIEKILEQFRNSTDIDITELDIDYLESLNLEYIKKFVEYLCENNLIDKNKVRQLVADDVYYIPFEDTVLMMLVSQYYWEYKDFLLSILK